MSKDYDRYYIQIQKGFKNTIIRKRKEFMELLIKVLGDDDNSVSELHNKFGAKLVTKTNNGNSISVLVDGERVFKL